MENRIIISEQDIDRILNPEIDCSYWKDELESAANYKPVVTGGGGGMMGFMTASRLWDEIKPKIHHLLCDEQKPKEWVNDLITGDLRNAAVGVITVITTTYNVPIAIAIPIAGLVFKYGLISFCASEK